MLNINARKYFIIIERVASVAVHTVAVNAHLVRKQVDCIWNGWMDDWHGPEDFRKLKNEKDISMFGCYSRGLVWLSAMANTLRTECSTRQLNVLEEGKYFHSIYLH